MIRESEKVFKCLNCDFKKDFSPPKPQKPLPIFAILIIGGGLVVFLNFLHETRDHHTPYDRQTPQAIAPLSSPAAKIAPQTA